MTAVLSGTPFFDTATVHPDLEHISQIESSSGTNKAHKTVQYGLNAGHSATGSYGLMPITVLETVKKNPDLSLRYNHLTNMSPNDITSYLNQNNTADAEIASAHWNRLGKLFPRDEARKAYAWKNGITGALRASDEEVTGHPYVKAYIKNKYAKQK